MVDINKVVLVGRLTRDAELRSAASGMTACKFSIAVNRRRKNGEQWEDEANFFDIVLWGRQGESLSQYLQKGKQVAVEGELRQYRRQQDGQNRSKVEVAANNVQLLGGAANRTPDTGGGYPQAPQYRQPSAQPQHPPQGSYQQQGGYQPPQQQRYNPHGAPPPDDFEDDIPF